MRYLMFIGIGTYSKRACDVCSNNILGNLDYRTPQLQSFSGVMDEDDTLGYTIVVQEGPSFALPN